MFRSNKFKNVLFIACNLFHFLTFSQGEYVVEINKQTGTYRKTGPAIDGIVYIYPDDRAYDEQSGTFIFQNAEDLLYGINVSNGAIVNRPFTKSTHAFQFDNAASLLYGIKMDQSAGEKYFVSIDPATGVCIKIGNSFPDKSMYSGNFSTFNEKKHNYLFLDPSRMLYSIDVATGSIISSPILQDKIIHFSFDNSTEKLYGLLYEGPLFFLVEIDPATGKNTRIGSGTTAAYTSGSATIDEANQQYIYLYNSSIGYEMTVLDIATGAVVNHFIIKAFQGNDNFLSLKYDRTRKKLYALHWSTSALGIEDNTVESAVRIAPNPFSSSTTVHTNKILNAASVRIFNASGQLVRQLKNISGQTVTIQRNDLPKGLYLLEIVQEGETVVKERLVIND